MFLRKSFVFRNNREQRVIDFPRQEIVVYQVLILYILEQSYAVENCNFI